MKSVFSENPPTYYSVHYIGVLMQRRDRKATVQRHCSFANSSFSVQRAYYDGEEACAPLRKSITCARFTSICFLSLAEVSACRLLMETLELASSLSPIIRA